MSNVFRSALCAALTSGLLLACAVDNARSPEPSTKTSASSIGTHARSSSRKAVPSVEPVKVDRTPAQVPHAILIRASADSTSVIETPTASKIDPLGNPRPFLPIPDPHIDEGAAAPTQPQMQAQSAAQTPAVPVETKPSHQDERPSAVTVPQAAHPQVNTPPAASPYQRAMLGTNNAVSPLGDSSKLQNSFILEVVFIVLIILCLAGAAWYRMNFDFGRPNRRPMRRD